VIDYAKRLKGYSFIFIFNSTAAIFRNTFVSFALIPKTATFYFNFFFCAFCYFLSLIQSHNTSVLSNDSRVAYTIRSHRVSMFH